MPPSDIQLADSQDINCQVCYCINTSASTRQDAFPRIGAQLVILADAPSASEKDCFVSCTGMTGRHHAESGIPPDSLRTLRGHLTSLASRHLTALI